MRKLQKPAVAVGSLIAVSALFIGVVIATYPESEDAKKVIPIVKADLRPIKSKPTDRGGMDIPHKKSTILAQVGQPPIVMKSDGIENLLAPPSNENLLSKEEAIENAMAHYQGESSAVDITEGLFPQAVEEPLTVAIESTSDDAAVQEIVVLQEPVPPSLGNEIPEARDILQKVGSSKNTDTYITSDFEQKVANAAVLNKPQRLETIHAAATSPETLDFVRSVLKQDSDVQAIEPSAGAANASASAGVSGDYFVQLASITDSARAGGEFSKMQAKYSVLSNSKFRLQEASLSSGQFYRIQAGPMSKDDANRICASLKSSGKPGGCLVVK